VLSACGSSDSGEDVEREAAAGTGECDAPPAIRVDWSGCDKSGADLARADLWRADLWRATLSDADLSSADLTRADLRKANLLGANLRDANLSGADLGHADHLYRAGCDPGTVWPDGTRHHGTTCPPTNYPPQISAITTLRRPLPQDQAAALGDPARSWGVAKLDPRGGSAERQAGTNGGTSTK